MGLLSFLTSQPEVMRVSAARQLKLLNAAAFPNIQSATRTETPLSNSGLDGTGEVIQVGEEPTSYGEQDTTGRVLSTTEYRGGGVSIRCIAQPLHSSGSNCAEPKAERVAVCMSVLRVEPLFLPIDMQHI